MRHYMVSTTVRKLAYCLGLLSVLLGACAKSEPPNDWQRLHLQSKVKEMEEWSYNSYAALKNKQHSRHQLSYFTETGNLSKGLFYQSPQHLWWSHYHYAEDSVWIRKTLQIEGRVEQNQSFWLYELNERGQQAVITSLLLDTSIFHKINVQFNEQQQPAEFIYSEQREPSKVPCRMVKTYNEQGQVIKELVYFYKENIQQCSPTPAVTTYKYNEKGHVLREKAQYDNGSNFVYSYQYKYDSFDNWTNRIHYRGDEVTEITQREFIYY